MTLSSLAQPFDSKLPADRERDVANTLRKIIAQSKNAHKGEAHLKVSDAKGKTADIVLPPAMSDTLLNLLRMISMGEAVTLVSVGEMLTTQRAADLLNISRPHLVKLLDAGELPHHKVGRHHRIRAEDLFAYREKRGQERRTALKELAELNEDID